MNRYFLLCEELFLRPYGEPPFFRRKCFLLGIYARYNLNVPSRGGDFPSHWRRERDSNPCGIAPNGFQDRLVMTTSISLRIPAGAVFRDKTECMAVFPHLVTRMPNSRYFLPYHTLFHLSRGISYFSFVEIEKMQTGGLAFSSII